MDSLRFAASAVAVCLFAVASRAGEPCRVILPEQRWIQTRSPDQLAQTPYLPTPRPATVTDPQAGAPELPLPLNEAINIALGNSEVVRVLTGFTASTSGRTIYDVAIVNTEIDQQRATFDPRLSATHSWNASKTPFAFPDPGDPAQSLIAGNRNHNHVFDFGLSKQNQLGGISDLRVNSNQQRFPGDNAPLDPQNRSNVDLRYTQPFLQGAGRAVNQAPIILARIDTERSYFQYKGSVQRLVQDVIGAYWSLVFAKTDLWARQQQVQQSQFAYQRTLARAEAGDANAGDLAQSRLARREFSRHFVGLASQCVAKSSSPDEYPRFGTV